VPNFIACILSEDYFSKLIDLKVQLQASHTFPPSAAPLQASRLFGVSLGHFHQNGFRDRAISA
jgi:hypothetical protein